MKPSDFVRTFERQFTVPGPTSFYSGIVGADKCSTKKCDLSQGVVADDSAMTLTIHLTAPDTEFFDKVALPFAYVVPGNTPLKLTGNNVPPGTGPYMWQSYDPNKAAVLVRNPYFKVWSKDAQPAGCGQDHREVRPADLRGSNPGPERPGGRGVRRRRHSSDRLNELNSAQYKDQVRESAHGRLVHGAQHQDSSVQQPEGPAGDQLRADRNAYVKIGGGTSLAVPTCRSCRPTSPATSRTARTPLDPTTPSGPRPTSPRRSSCAAVRDGRHEGGREQRHRRDQQGARPADGVRPEQDRPKASTQLLNASIQYPFVQNSNNSKKWQVAWSAWYQDYPVPSDFLNVLLGCGSIHPGSDASPNIAAFCDQAIQAKMTQASSMQLTNLAGANDLWAQVDHEVTDQAPWVDLYNPKQIDFLSKRVGNYQWNPQWYILIDQLWVQ
jgi:peptide/nickel transport system substrate-binding protein